MGTAGTDVAIEASDVALMGDNLNSLVFALKLSKKNRKVVLENLVISMSVISIFVFGAISGMFNLPIVIIGHELSEIIVIMNGLRLLKL